MNNSKYTIVDENKLREQFENFMKGVYDQADELSLELSSELLNSFKNLLVNVNQNVIAKNLVLDNAFAESSLDYSKKLSDLSKIEEDLHSKTYKELKEIAKSYNIKGYNSMKKSFLELEISKAIYFEKENLSKNYEQNKGYYNEISKDLFLGIDKYVRNNMEVLKYKLDTERNEIKLQFYSKLFDKYSNIDYLILNIKAIVDSYDRSMKRQKDILKLIKYTKEEINKIDVSINSCKEKLNSASDIYEKTILKNDIKALKAQKSVHTRNISKYQNNINKFLNVNLNNKSPKSYQSQFLNNIDDIKTLISEANEQNIIDINSDEYKNSFRDLDLCKEQITDIFKPSVEKEDKLDELLGKYGLSKNNILSTNEEQSKEELLVEDTKIEEENISSAEKIIDNNEPSIDLNNEIKTESFDDGFVNNTKEEDIIENVTISDSEPIENSEIIKENLFTNNTINTDINNETIENTKNNSDVSDQSETINIINDLNANPPIHLNNEIQEDYVPTKFEAVATNVVNGINNAGDKFVDGLKTTGRIVKNASKDAVHKISDIHEKKVETKKAEKRARRISRRVKMKKVLTPVTWTASKAKAFAAATSRKIHEWAQEDISSNYYYDFTSSENINNTEERGVSR